MRNGLAFISSGLRLGDNDIYNDREGKIYLFDMKEAQSQPEELDIDAPKDFDFASPHGISTWTDSTTGTVYLYVISHHPQEVVDKFLFLQSSKTLKHMRRIGNVSDFIALNNLAVVGEDQFFFTNKYSYWQTMEVLLRLRFGSVGFFDGSHCKLVETGLFIPNGIALSPDGRMLYVAVMGDKEIRVYRINNNSLALTNSVNVRTHLDNLNVDPWTGDIWFGAHPAYYRSGLYTLNPVENTSPSQVMRVKMSSNGHAGVVEEIYSNNGTEISGSSVAVVYERTMLIGSIASAAYCCELYPGRSIAYQLGYYM